MVIVQKHQRESFSEIFYWITCISIILVRPANPILVLKEWVTWCYDCHVYIYFFVRQSDQIYQNVHTRTKLTKFPRTDNIEMDLPKSESPSPPLRVPWACPVMAECNAANVGVVTPSIISSDLYFYCGNWFECFCFPFSFLLIIHFAMYENITI